MKKLKTQKGITLVALIITIVVLLILAVVSIGAVKDSNIIGHAQNAAEGYKQGENNETILIGQYESEIEKNIPKEATKEEIWGEYSDEYGKYLYYIGDSKELKIDSDIIMVEEIELIYDEETDSMTYTKKEGTKKTGKFEDYENIEFRHDFNKVEKIDFGNKLSSKNKLSFYDNNIIKEVKGLEGLTIIDGFGYSKSLEKVIIPYTATSISVYGFEHNRALSSIVIPENIDTIGENAFSGCDNLTEIIIKRQEGYFTEEQLKNAGLTDEQIANILWES